jgi:hypothetical protein
VHPRHVTRLAGLLKGETGKVWPPSPSSVLRLSSHTSKVLCGGTYDEKERYFAPTVVELQSAVGSELMKDEIFGPILYPPQLPSFLCQYALVSCDWFLSDAGRC